MRNTTYNSNTPLNTTSKLHEEGQNGWAVPLILVLVILTLAYSAFQWYNNSYTVNDSRFTTATPVAAKRMVTVNPDTTQAR